MERQTALLVVSGKVLEKPFALDALDAIRNSVERSLAERNVVLTRRVATLGLNKHLAAPFFLAAGFETIPADDEDLQATTLICKEVFSQNPPTEVVCCLGLDEPIEFMRAIASSPTRRVLLRLTEPDDQGISYSLGQNLEGILDVRELLSKEGVDWSRLDRRVWDDWAAQFDAALSGSVRVETPQQPALGCENLDLADETSTQTTTFSSEVPPSEVAPTSSEEVAVEDLIEPIDDVQRLASDAAKWNELMVAKLRENELKYSANRLTEELDPSFPGLNRLFLEDREKFRKMLCPEIRLVSDYEEGTHLYHVDHPEMAPVNAAEVVAIQEKIFETQDESSVEDVAKIVVKSVETRAKEACESLAKHSGFLKRACAWKAESLERMALGNSFYVDIETKNRELEAEWREMGGKFCPWPLHRSNSTLDKAEYKKAENAYDALKSALGVLNKARRASAVDQSFIPRVFQTVADCQCYIKSILRRNSIAVSYDSVQHDAFAFVQAFRTFYAGDAFIKNLTYDSELTDAQFDALTEEIEFLRKRVEDFKRREQIISSLKYHLEKLDDCGNDGVFHWQKIVETVTVLCAEYGEKPSSVLLREALVDKLDWIPEEVDATDEFCQVVQQIEMYLAFEEEKQAAEFEYTAVEKRVFPEVEAVKERFGGTKIVFIGGVPTDHMRERIEKAFDVTMIWEKTNHGDSLDRIKPYLNDDEVSMFIIYIPWCSHKHSEEFVTMGKGSGKLFVRVRKGTSPQQIANSVCEQMKNTEAE